jgi:hypothetical protein
MTDSRYTIDRDQVAWCIRLASRCGGYRLDRDDLLSAALEAVWRGLEAEADDLYAYAYVAFRRARTDLLRRAWVRRRGRQERVVLEGICDDRSVDPGLIVMAQEALGRGWDAPACKLCGTRGGPLRPGYPRQPRRIRGLCYPCDQRRRRLDRGLAADMELDLREGELVPVL